MSDLNKNNMQQSVLMLLQSDFPPDIRVEKEAQTLIRDGHFSVTLLCNNKKNAIPVESYKTIHVQRLSYWQILGKKINNLKNYPLWFNPVWLFRGIVTTMKMRPDFIHVHDLPLMFLGFILAKVSGAKLIYDLHENYPATFDLWKKGGILKPFIRNRYLARWYDRFSISKADGVIVVEPEHREWIQENYGIKRSISAVSNTVDLDYYVNIPINEKIVREYKDSFILCYVGNISAERDLDVAIRAVQILKKKISNLKFLIVGEGPERVQLEKISSELGLKQVVVFTGWVPFEDTATYIRISRICLIPQGSNDLIDNGTPHKLYQYMSLGKPVIVSDAKAMKRVVVESRCGEFFRSGDKNSFAEAVIKIVKGSNNYGENGQLAVQSKYNWQISAAELIRLYETI